MVFSHFERQRDIENEQRQQDDCEYAQGNKERTLSIQDKRK